MCKEYYVSLEERRKDTEVVESYQNILLLMRVRKVLKPSTFMEEGVIDMVQWSGVRLLSKRPWRSCINRLVLYRI